MAEDKLCPKPPVFVRDATGLVRQVTWLDAMQFNLQAVGMGWPLIWMGIAPFLYPGMDIPIDVLICLPILAIISVPYIMLATMMPRTGGDYVWVSRTLHPAIGFMENFAMVIIISSFTGSSASLGVTGGVETIFLNLGTLLSNPSLTAIGTSLSSPNNLFVLMVIWVIILVIPLILGTRPSFLFQWIMFGLMILGFAAYVGAFLSAGHAGFVSNFNAISGMNYDAVIPAATNAGYNPSITSFGTVLGAMFIFGTMFGWQFSTYISGEIRDVQKSQMYALFGTIIFVGVLWFIVYSVGYNVMGQEWLHSLAYLSGTGSSAYKLPSPPYGNFMVTYATSNPVLPILASICVIAGAFGTLEAIYVVCVRNIFAWSFDRVAPTKLADMNERFHSPLNAIAVVALLGFFFCYVAAYTSMLSMFTLALSCQALAAAFMGVAAIVIPWRRKDLFEAAPDFVKKRIAGVPAITLSGAVSVILLVAIAVGTLTPAFNGGPLNPNWIYGALAIFLVGLPLYAVSYYYHKSKGIDLALVFKEVPPE